MLLWRAICLCLFEVGLTEQLDMLCSVVYGVLAFTFYVLYDWFVVRYA